MITPFAANGGIGGLNPFFAQPLSTPTSLSAPNVAIANLGAMADALLLQSPAESGGLEQQGTSPVQALLAQIQLLQEELVLEIQNHQDPTATEGQLSADVQRLQQMLGGQASASPGAGAAGDGSAAPASGGSSVPDSGGSSVPASGAATGSSGSAAPSNTTASSAAAGPSSNQVVNSGGVPTVLRQGKPIGAAIAPQFDAMVKAAQASGVNLQIEDGYRSPAQQQALWNANPNPTMVARPGTSEHEKGDAIDFKNTPGAFAWLQQNSTRFGFHNYPPEPWHYSTSGH